MESYVFFGCGSLESVMFLGDAPELLPAELNEYNPTSDYDCFNHDSAVTVYYYSDTEGWTDEYKATLAYEADITWVELDRESDDEEAEDSEDNTSSDDSSDDISSDTDTEETSASLGIIDSAATASYTLGSGTAAVIAVDADIDTFVCVTVDGTVLIQDTDYTVTEGSTIITFTESFLETLSEGEHDVVIAFEGGDVETTLTIAAAESSSDSDDSEESEAAEVGDSSGLAFWMVLGLLAALGLAGAGLRRRVAR